MSTPQRHGSIHKSRSGLVESTGAVAYGIRRPRQPGNRGGAPTVYANVPANIIVRVIQTHGGLRHDSTIPPPMENESTSVSAAAAATHVPAAASATTKTQRDEGSAAFVVLILIYGTKEAQLS